MNHIDLPENGAKGLSCGMRHQIGERLRDTWPESLKRGSLGAASVATDKRLRIRQDILMEYPLFSMRSMRVERKIYAKVLSWIGRSSKRD
jgi:hypothetical protein